MLVAFVFRHWKEQFLLNPSSCRQTVWHFIFTKRNRYSGTQKVPNKCEINLDKALDLLKCISTADQRQCRVASNAFLLPFKCFFPI